VLQVAIQIGALSKRTGLSVDAIRFYEREHLLPSPRRSEGGFRLFREQDVAVLQFIKSAQELGFSLDEVRELLLLRDQDAKACPKMERLLRAKLTSVENKIAALNVIGRELKSALRKCAVALNSSPSAEPQTCPVLDEIAAKQRLERE
jgi:DNA-binding transcriptional MerR regulator